MTEVIVQRDKGGSYRRYDVAASLWPLLRHATLIAAAVVVIYPILWMIASSLRVPSEIFSQLGLLVGNPHWQNYVDGWNALREPFGLYLFNSGVLVFGAVVGNLVSCALAAYAFARLDFKFKAAAFAIMLGTIMLPVHVLIVPQYIMFAKMQLLNTFWPIILPKFLATDSFFIFLMVQFIRGLPRELDEAARIDGCGHLRTFAFIILPLMLPALATTAIFTFIWTWNDFFSQLIFLTKPKMFTAPIALRSFSDSTEGTDWGPLFAMACVSLLPLFIVFLAGQRLLLKGIATTGIK